MQVKLVATLSEQNIEAELSYAYLHGVASRAGFICEYTGRNTDASGIDAVIRVKERLASDSIYTSFPVEIQLKATRRPVAMREDMISFSIDLKNYDDLRSLEAVAPQLLVVLFLPENAEKWLVHTEDRLTARRCAYWVSLRGACESQNTTSQTVYLPRSQMLSVTSLRTLMTRFSRGENIDYGA